MLLEYCVSWMSREPSTWSGCATVKYVARCREERSLQQQTNFRSMPLVTVAAVVIAIVLSFICSGVLGGTAISVEADGELSDEASPFAHAGPVISIWSV